MTIRKLSTIPSIGEYTFRENNNEPQSDDLFHVGCAGNIEGYISTKITHNELVNSFPLKETGILDQNDLHDNSDTDVPTQRSVKQYVDNSSLTSAPNVLSSITTNTIYTNNTGGKIMVTLSGKNAYYMWMSAIIGENNVNTNDGAYITSMSSFYSGTDRCASSIAFIVPDKWKYIIDIHDPSFWFITNPHSVTISAEIWGL